MEAACAASDAAASLFCDFFLVNCKARGPIAFDTSALGFSSFLLADLM